MSMKSESSIVDRHPGLLHDITVKRDKQLGNQAQASRHKLGRSRLGKKPSVARAEITGLVKINVTW